jgi:hypothetical protein
MNKSANINQPILSFSAPENLRTLLLISRYPSRFIPFAFLSMAFFHFPLFLNWKLKFYKLMGSGKNGTFDIRPDFNQWAIMVFFDADQYPEEDIKQLSKQLLGKFIIGWWRFFKADTRYFLLEPYAGHGTWDGKSFLDSRIKIADPEGKIAVLTRATIRLSRLQHFWKAVPKTADKLEANKGFVYSVGIGEIPFIKQATFSVWESIEDMKAFAYKKMAHQDVIRRTRKESWYSEEMFLRFKILRENATL